MLIDSGCYIALLEWRVLFFLERGVVKALWALLYVCHLVREVYRGALQTDLPHTPPQRRGVLCSSEQTWPPLARAASSDCLRHVGCQDWRGGPVARWCWQQGQVRWGPRAGAGPPTRWRLPRPAQPHADRAWGPRRRGRRRRQRITQRGHMAPATARLRRAGGHPPCVCSPRPTRWHDRPPPGAADRSPPKTDAAAPFPPTPLGRPWTASGVARTPPPPPRPLPLPLPPPRPLLQTPREPWRRQAPTATVVPAGAPRLPAPGAAARHPPAHAAGGMDGGGGGGDGGSNDRWMSDVPSVGSDSDSNGGVPWWALQDDGNADNSDANRVGAAVAAAPPSSVAVGCSGSGSGAPATPAVPVQRAVTPAAGGGGTPPARRSGGGSGGRGTASSSLRYPAWWLVERDKGPPRGSPPPPRKRPSARRRQPAFSPPTAMVVARDVAALLGDPPPFLTVYHSWAVPQRLEALLVGPLETPYAVRAAPWERWAAGGGERPGGGAHAPRVASAAGTSVRSGVRTPLTRRPRSLHLCLPC